MFIARLRTETRPEDDQKHAYVALRTFEPIEAQRIALALVTEINRLSDDAWVYSIFETAPAFAIEAGDVGYVANEIAVAF